MPQSPDADSFDELLALLRKHDLGWLVDDAIADVALGKTEKRILTKRLPADGEYQSIVVAHDQDRDSRKQKEFLTSEPFSDRERLERLIQAIENTIVESAGMEASILRTTNLELTFTDIGAEPSSTRDIEISVVQTRTRDARRLSETLGGVLSGTGGEE